MVTTQFEAREWIAQPKNLSPNGIHDDDRAKELGFEGGFVTGVALYEHIAAELMNQGLPWLDEGRVDLRFRRPVYDDEAVTFFVDTASNGYEIRSDDGMGPRSTGVFEISDEPPAIPTGEAATPPSMVGLGDESLVGLVMRIEQQLDPSRFDEVAANSSFPRESGGRKLIPIGQWINPIDLIYEYFGRSTTIHFAGRIWHHSGLFEDESFTTTGVITGFSERRGNRIVDFTSLIEAGDGRPLATLEHRSVFQLARERAAEGG